MEIDLLQQVADGLAQQLQQPVHPEQVELIGVRVRAESIRYEVALAHSREEPVRLMRVRLQNRTDQPQKRVVCPSVPEMFSASLVPIRWPVPLEFSLSPPPGVERLILTVRAGAEVSRRARRPLRMVLNVPADTELLSELAFRPAAGHGRILATLVVNGRVRPEAGAAAVDLSLSFPVHLGSWTALGVDEVLLEDQQSSRLPRLRTIPGGLSIPNQPPLLQPPGAARSLTELYGLQENQLHDLLELGLHTVAELAQQDPQNALLHDLSLQQWQRLWSMAEILAWCPELSGPDAWLLVHGLKLRSKQNLSQLEQYSEAQLRLLASNLNLPQGYSLERILSVARA